MKLWLKKTMAPVLLLMLALTGLFSNLAAQQSNGNIKGQVTDPEGGALPGASVQIKGTNRGIVTDISGNY